MIETLTFLTVLDTHHCVACTECRRLFDRHCTGGRVLGRQCPIVRRFCVAILETEGSDFLDD